MNGAILSAVIIMVYVIALMHYCDGQIFQSDINNKLMDARTVAFISLVWSENVRSYVSRSFDQPVWVNFLGNKNMQKAIALAQAALYAAVLIPGFSDMILNLRGVEVGLFGWALALVGPVGCVVLCEIAKLLTKMQKESYQKELALRLRNEEKAPQVMRKASSSRPVAARVKSVQKVASPTHEIEKVGKVKVAKGDRSNKGLCRCLLC